MFQAPKHMIDEVKCFEKNPKSLAVYTKNLQEKLEEQDWFKQRPEHIKKLYRELPVFGFFKIKSSGRPTRITGFHELENGQITAQTHNFLIGMNMLNSTVGGWPIEDLELVPNWSKKDIEDIEFYSIINPDLAYIYRHPMGILFLTN